MRKPRGSKYVFSTQILSRGQKFIKTLLARRGFSPSQELFQACFNLVQELVLIRLMELNWILEDGWLKSRITSQAGLSDLWDQEKSWNEVLGVEIFCPWLNQSLDLKAEELFEFVQRLYQKKFLDPKSPGELVGACLEKFTIIPRSHAPFFTPANLVQMMVDESFKYLGWDQGRLEDKKFMVLDPSFGTGNFLLGLLRKMILVEENYYAHRPSGLFYPLVRLPDLSRTLEAELKIELIREHLFGLELNGLARLSALRALVLLILRGKKIMELSSGQMQFLEKNFPLGDFLLEQPVRQQINLFDAQTFQELHPFNFQDSSFPHRRALEQGGFELIIGNPPWLSLKGKQALHPYSPEVVNYLLERYQADSYRPNLFELFIRRGIELVKSGGINCFLVPDRLAENLQFQPLREFMLQEGEILRLHLREPFPGVVSDSLIYWFRKKGENKARKILLTDARGAESELSAQRFIRKGAAILKEVSPSVLSLLDKIQKESRGKFSDYLSSGVGLIARAGSIHSEKVLSNEQEIIKGENVQRWRISGHYYFEFHPRNLIGGTVRYSKLTAPIRILVRKTGAQLIGTLDQSKFLVEQSVYFLLPRPGRRMKYALEYFLALLNSKLMNFYYRHYLITNPGSTPQIKKFHLDQLPVKRLNLKELWDKELYQEIIELVKQLTTVREAGIEAELEQKLNQLVFDLYHLNSRERELILRKE